MPTYMYAKSKPIKHLAHGQRWPYGRLVGNPPRMEALHAQEMGQRLHKAIAGRKKGEIAKLAGISHDILTKLLKGETWGSVPTIVRLEQALNTSLWCGKAHPDGA